jgi:3-isopropylmalate/(R)-2-methylmalate dehydratase small subunit
MPESVIKSIVRAKYGDNITTDTITAGKYITSTKPEDLVKIAFKDHDNDFARKLSEGGILVAGKNFGAGSAKQTAPVALKAANVKVVVAEFFARIFYRNAINIGLPLVECQGISDAVNEGDELEVDFVTGQVTNLNSGKSYQGTAMPEFLLEIIDSGGIVSYLKNSLSKQNLVNPDPTKN